jgi:hypothetical protein
MAQLGRISGPLLEQNLRRDGVDIKFSNTTFDSTSVFYIDVNNGRIGIKDDTPSFDLDINSDLRTTDLQIDNTARIDNILARADGTFTTVLGPINIMPQTAGSYMTFQRMRSDDLDFNDNTISGINTNQTIELKPSGTGTVEVSASTNIYGNLGVTGNITLDGNLTKLGDLVVGDELYDPDTGLGDTVTIVPDFTQSIIPGDNLLWDLGRNQLDSSPRRWGSVYITDNLSNTGTPLPLEVRVSDQTKIDGVANEILALQSNDDIVLAPDTGINIVEWTKWNEVTASSTAADINGFILTVGGTVTGTFVPGMLLSGIGIIPGTVITGTSTGSDSSGTYTVNFNYDGSGSRPSPTGTIAISGKIDSITNLTDIGTGGPRVFPETPLTLVSTGIGYVRFTDTNAFLIPTGGDAERPTRPELGDTRWNTDRNYLEVFAGTIESVTGIANVSGLPNQLQSNLSGTTNGNGENARFSIGINSGTLDTITITTVGQGYSEYDIITIPGTSFTGGLSPANDVILTVGPQTNSGYVLSTGGGAEVDVPLMEDFSNVYSLILA